MNFILSDDGIGKQFWPLSFTRSVADFRIGVLTIKEKYEILLNSNVSIHTEKYLQNKYKLIKHSQNIIINPTIIPDKNLISAILSFEKNALVKGRTIIAVRSKGEKMKGIIEMPDEAEEYKGEIKSLKNIASIFLLNADEIKSDFELITKNRQSAVLGKTNTVIGSDKQLFIEEGCTIEASTINTTKGPVYIGKNSEIMEGAHIRGPFSFCENSLIKMGTKIYGGTTIGPGSKVAGEINNSVLFGNSNKAHDGFLGNAVIGEWCNIGADTNNSNLKNNYSNVRIWSYEKERFLDSGLQFCGLFMGDHSKCGINTMFNTGTVVGVSANIYGAGFPRTFIPSFTMGGHSGFTEYRFDKAIETAKIVLKRRGLELSDEDISILEHIYKISRKYRT